MNRYVAAGVATDASAGMRVLMVLAHTGLIRDVLDDVARARPALVDKVVKANGSERAYFHGGGVVLFTTPRSLRARGVAVDVVYIDSGVDPGDVDWDELRPVLSVSRRGEVIRA